MKAKIFWSPCILCCSRAIVPIVFHGFVLKISSWGGKRCFVITEKLKCRKIRRLFSWPTGKIKKGQELKLWIQLGPSRFLSSLHVRNMVHSHSHISDLGIVQCPHGVHLDQRQPVWLYSETASECSACSSQSSPWALRMGTSSWVVLHTWAKDQDINPFCDSTRVWELTPGPRTLLQPLN